MCDNYFGFIMDNFATEIAVMSVKIALTNFELPFDASKCKNFDRFHEKYGKLIISAMKESR